MNKQIIYIIAIVVIVLVGFIILSKPNNTASSQSQPNQITPADGSLTAPETSHDFGTISMAKGKVTKNFVITNTEDGSVEIKRIETSCMCTTAFLNKGSERLGPFGMPGHGGPSRPVRDVVLPGESRVIEVIFDPAAHGPAGVGPIERVVTITDAVGGATNFTIKATVTP